MPHYTVIEVLKRKFNWFHHSCKAYNFHKDTIRKNALQVISEAFSVYAASNQTQFKCLVPVGGLVLNFMVTKVSNSFKLLSKNYLHKVVLSAQSVISVIPPF